MRVIDLQTRIAPFGDAVGDLPLLDASLAEVRAREVRTAKVAPERLTFADYAIATSELLQRFCARPPGEPGALALPSTSPCAAHVPISSVRKVDDLLVFDIFLDGPKGASLEALRADARPIVVETEQRVRRREIFRVGPEPHFLDLPDNGVVAAHVEHWAHLLWLAPLLVPTLLARRPGKRHHPKNSKRPSFIGKDADVHPSAFIEGSIIGEGAEIGASCAIRNSYVGPRSKISDYTKVGFSVMGAETHTLADATFHDMVSLGGGTLASLLLKDSILGRSVFLTTGVIFWSESLDGLVQVSHHGQTISSGRKNLGGCAGHGCVLGARTIVSPGRSLPNRTTVVMRTEESVKSIADTEAGTPMCWYDGALVPVEKVRPGYAPDELGDGTL